MWHRFPVVLTLLTAGSVGGLSYLALSPQTASAPSPLGVESTEVQSDTVASTYLQDKKRSGSGRRGMRG
jgi:hypothetical protein